MIFPPQSTFYLLTLLALVWLFYINQDHTALAFRPLTTRKSRSAKRAWLRLGTMLGCINT